MRRNRGHRKALLIRLFASLVKRKSLVLYAVLVVIFDQALRPVSLPPMESPHIFSVTPTWESAEPWLLPFRDPANTAYYNKIGFFKRDMVIKVDGLKNIRQHVIVEPVQKVCNAGLLGFFSRTIICRTKFRVQVPITIFTHIPASYGSLSEEEKKKIPEKTLPTERDGEVIIYKIPVFSIIPRLFASEKEPNFELSKIPDNSWQSLTEARVKQTP